MKSSPPPTCEAPLAALEAFGHALKHGQAAAAPPSPPADASDSLHADWHGVTECMRLLADLWPASAAESPITPTEQSLGGAAPPSLGIGHFRLLRPLGRGGFGLVFLAYDLKLFRLVAIKVPRPDLPLTDAALLRFLREGEAAAGLNHPHIVPVHEAGMDGQHPYIAAAYCPGPTLAAWLGARSCPVQARSVARLGVQLADALRHAHNRGVLHYDLKPGNVLLQRKSDPPEPDGQADDGATNVADSPLSDYIPRITDFGLARLANQSAGDGVKTALAGTPSYMAPEQALGLFKDLGLATDVYGLGAILYALLVGQPPFVGANDADTLLRVVTTDPFPPRRLRTDVPADLEAVCLKCLEKQPAQRYTCAAALAEDLCRFLDGRPTAARPLGRVRRSLRWVNRRPDLASLIVLMAVTVVAALTAFGWLSIRVGESRAETRAAQQLASVYEFHALIDRVRQRRLEPRPGWTDTNLADLRRAVQLEPAAEHLSDLRSEAIAALTGTDLRLVRSISPGLEVYNVAFSPDGRWLALGEWATSPVIGRVRLVGAHDGHTIRDLTFPSDLMSRVRARLPDGCRGLVFSPDGRWLVAASRFGGLHRWDLHAESQMAVSWNADGTSSPTLAFGTVRPLLFGRTDTKLQCWDAADDWKELALSDSPAATGQPVIDPAAGQLAFTAGGMLHLWDGRGLKPLRPPVPVHGTGVAIGRDGQTMALEQDGSIWICDIASGHLQRQLIGREGESTDAQGITNVEFSPGGGLLTVTSEWSRHIKVWDAVGGRLMTDCVAGPGGSMRLAFHPDGRTIAVASKHTAVDVYEITGQEIQSVDALQPFSTWAAALGPDGRSLICLARANTSNEKAVLTYWQDGIDRADGEPHRLTRRYPAHRPTVTVAPSGFGVVYSTDQGMEFWASPCGDTEYQPLEDLKQVKFGPDGRLWAAAAHTVIAFTLPNWREVARWTHGEEEQRAGSVYYTVAPGADWVLAGRRDGRVLVLDAAARYRDTWGVGFLPVTALALNESAGLAVAGDEAGRLRVFHLPTGEVKTDLPEAHRDAVSAAAIAPNAQLVATGGHDRAIRLWGPDGKEVLTFRTTGPVAMLTFTPDEEELIALVAGERGVRRWHLGRLAEKLRELGIDPGISLPKAYAAIPLLAPSPFSSR
jgi:serine/threonine protein kinase/WD40 repeat protein